MNKIITELFKKLSLEDDHVRYDAYMNLSLLIESVFNPGVAQTNDKLYSEPELVQIKLTVPDVESVLMEVYEELTNEIIPLDIRIGLASLIGKFNKSNMEYLGGVLSFVHKYLERFDNDQLYSFFASFCLSHFDAKLDESVKQLLGVFI